MGREIIQETHLVGRESELRRLDNALRGAVAGRGGTVLVTGEAGMGKTRLVRHFMKSAEESGARILAGAVEADKIRPLSPFQDALARILTGPLLDEHGHTSFAGVFAFDLDGSVLGSVSGQGEGINAGALVKMLAAVQMFIGDAFEKGDVGGATLGRLEYGNMKVMTERGESMLVTGVFHGDEHPEMRDALRRELQLMDARGRLSIMDGLARLVETKFAVSGVPEHPSLENERMKLAEKALHALIAASSEEVAVLILEDMHWADDSALYILEYLARNIRDSHILQVCTMRPEENMHLDALAKKMVASGEAVAFKLGRLSKEDISAIVSARAKEQPVWPRFLDELAELSGGNPLFITELLKQLDNDSMSGPVAGVGLAIPTSLEEITRMRMDSLEPAAVKLVEYASCMGRTFDAVDLLSMKSVADPKDVLTSAIREGIIMPRGDRLEFTHLLFRDLIYRDISPRWRAAYHKELGQYLEVAFAGNEDAVIYELARHFSRSTDYAKAHVYCSKAGERAESEHAPAQALEMYKLALMALEKADRVSDPSSTAGLMERIGDMHTIMGKQGEALDSYAGAAGRYYEPNTLARVMRKAAEVLMKKGDLDAASTSLAKAGKAAGSVHGLEYGRILLLQGEIMWRRGNRASAAELLAEAGRAFDSTKSSPRDVSSVLNQMGALHFRMGNMAEAMDYLQQSLELAQSVGYLPSMSQSLNNIALIHFETGRLDMAIECFNDSFQLLQKMGNLSTMPSILGNLGTAHYLMGNMDLSWTYQTQALEMRVRFGQKGGMANTHLALGLVRLVHGELDLALEEFFESREIWTSIGEKQALPKALINIGEVHLLRGELALAGQAYSEALTIGESLGDLLRMSAALTGLACTSLSRGDAKGANNHATRAAEFAARGGGKSHEGNALRALGASYAALGDAGRAELALKRSVDILAGCPDKGELAYAQYEYGKFLISAGRQAEARTMLDTSLRTFESRGMRLWAARAVEALGEEK